MKINKKGLALTFESILNSPFSNSHFVSINNTGVSPHSFINSHFINIASCNSLPVICIVKNK